VHHCHTVTTLRAHAASANALIPHMHGRPNSPGGRASALVIREEHTVGLLGSAFREGVYVDGRRAIQEGACGHPRHATKEKAITSEAVARACDPLAFVDAPPCLALRTTATRCS